MEGSLTLHKMLKYVLFALTVTLSLLVVWWYYGEPLSEETSYKLAQDYLSDFSNKNHIDLSQYNTPNIKHQKSDFYTFEWSSKGGGKPLTVAVDPLRAEVYMDN